MKCYLIALPVLLFGGQSAAVAALPAIRLEPISQQQIVAPVGITNAGDGSNRLFVTDQRGTIRVIENGSMLQTPLLDIESRLVPERPNFDERGLLGLAFHPQFGQTGEVGADKFYVYYSAPRPGGDPDDPIQPVNHQSVIAEYSVTSLGSNVADPSSERILLTFDQPQFNHDAGYLGFGPDNLLYVTTGDGGGADDNDAGHTGGNAGKPAGGLGNAQDLTQLLGKVLRIDVDGTNGPGGQYGIPGDNPFVGEGGGVHEEIYAYGLRNPWRASFDNGPGGSGRLFVADVGQGDVEEVNLIEPGGNYGWRIQEGTFDFDPSVSPTPSVPLIDPIAEYAHPGSANGLLEVGLAVTGGVVYRGSDFPELQGAYLFADWSNGFAQPNGTLLGLEETEPGVFNLSPLEVEGGNPIGQFIQAFGLDESGEAYVATKVTLAPSALDPDTGLPTGAIYRITVVPEPSAWLLLLMGLVATTKGPNRRGTIRP
jgi:glucose/arabinose dehydrogenase